MPDEIIVGDISHNAPEARLRKLASGAYPSDFFLTLLMR